MTESEPNSSAPEESVETEPTDQKVLDGPDEHAEDLPEGDRFERAYVEKLRDESAKHRTARKVAENALQGTVEQLRALALQHYAGNTLTDSTSLPWSDEFTNDDGTVNGDAIIEAAEQLVRSRPQLAKASGDIGAGFRGADAQGVSLLSLLQGSA